MMGQRRIKRRSYQGFLPGVAVGLVVMCMAGMAFLWIDQRRTTAGEVLILRADSALALKGRKTLAGLGSVELFERGNALVESDTFLQGIDILDWALEMDPENAAAFFVRGSAYKKMDKINQAIRDFDQAIKIEPKYSEAFYNRGLANMKLDRYRQAVHDFDQAIEIEPEYSLAYLNRGAAKLSLGDYRSAVEDYKSAAGLGVEEARKWLAAEGIKW